MFEKATSWELKLGRVASIVFTGLFGFLFLNYFIEQSQSERNYFSLSFISCCLGFLFYSLVLTSWLFFKNEKRDERFYPIALMVSAVTVNFSMFADFHFDHIFEILLGPEESLEYIGRSLYYQFISVPIIIIFALFHIRIWAIFLFLFLSVSPIIFKNNLIISHPSTFLQAVLSRQTMGLRWMKVFLGSPFLCVLLPLYFLWVSYISSATH